ncbi:MAG: 3',5'-nucleoside bisphosphate phosphatase [Burkholderiales bacterium]
MNADLHCHSTVSDGTLSPAEVAGRAAANGVSLWTLTDHDSTQGLAEAREAAAGTGMRFIGGVEISVTWSFQNLHVVGLNVDPKDLGLGAGLEKIRFSRRSRAERIAEQFNAAGIKGSLDGAYAFAGNPDLISRTHFARFLVAQGYARDMTDVFQRYLSAGRTGCVRHQWADLSEAVGWIRASGGVAVLAHPGRYKLSREQLMRLVREFKACGGAAIEVVTASHSDDQAIDFALLCKTHGLLASRGSDFHDPNDARYDLGMLPALPPSVTPVWSEFA